MEKSLDRYFEFEEKVMANTINSVEIEEWKALNKGMMNNNRIEDTLRNDEVNASRLHVKMKLEAAFEEKFGSESITDDVTETEMFNHARKEIIKSFNGETVGGLYLVESLHNVALRVKDFLLNSDLIDEVYATDQEMVDFTVARLRAFNPKNL